MYTYVTAYYQKVLEDEIGGLPDKKSIVKVEVDFYPTMTNFCKIMQRCSRGHLVCLLLLDHCHI